MQKSTDETRKILARLALMCLCIVFLAACAPAKSNVQTIDARTLHVTTKATGIGNRSDVLKSLYTEVAREAAQRGYSHFLITDSNSYDDVRLVHKSGDVQYNYSYNSLLNRYEANRQQQESTVREDRRPAIEATVRLYKAGEIDPSQEGVWDVNSILAQTQEKQK
ncbi:MAG: hypothetical protein HDQ92_07060 [Desulfovibrio sp.]|nr:hypothetical protein [Desulfovibrio sp.]